VTKTGLETYLDLEASMNTFGNREHEQFPFGVRMWKTRQDMARYEAVIRNAKPEMVVETGTKWGGSALWFASLGLSVVTVDVNLDPSRTAHAIAGHQGFKIRWVRGSSTAPETFNLVQKLVRGKRVMVSLDSDHHKLHVMNEIALYGTLVTPHQYLVVEDGIFDLAGTRGRRGGKRIPTEGGPLAAINEMLVVNNDPAFWFDRDTRVEKMSPVTHHPAGFWWRVE
jgi:cephalosporin hydroxylase